MIKNKKRFNKNMNKKLNKKGLTPVIAVILLLMMTVAVAGAAFYWLVKIQGSMQSGTESYEGKLVERMAGKVGLSAVYYDRDNKLLKLYLQNQGNTEIPLTDSATPPTTTWILLDNEQQTICSGDWSGNSAAGGYNAKCTGTGCDSALVLGAVREVILDLDYQNSGLCDISDDDDYPEETMFYFVADFSGKATAGGQFLK